MPVRIRPARWGDREPIAEWTSDTFDWGDYVAESLPAWLADDTGLAMVAVDDDDRPIGFGRVVLLSDVEAWLHAARVHPLHRGMGIGSALNGHGCAWAVRRGAVVARLMIEDWNDAARRQVEKSGYRPVAPWAWATRSVADGELDPRANGGRRAPGEERLIRGTTGEAEPSWISWSASDLAATGRQLLPVNWHFRRMTIQDVTDAARRRALWQCPSGWVIADMVGDEMVVSWVVTSDLDADRLARALLDRTDDAGARELRVWTPAVPWMLENLAGTGFEIHPATVYAKPL